MGTEKTERKDACDGHRPELAKLRRRVAALEKSERLARLAAEKYRGIFDNAVEGIFRSTPEGKFIAVNLAIARVLGYDSPEEAIRSVRDIQRQLYAVPGDRAELKRRLAEQGVVRGFETRVCRKDGTSIWISLSAQAVRDEKGDILCYEGTIEDITERKERERELETIVALGTELRGASSRSEMVPAILAHVLRLPGLDAAFLAMRDQSSGETVIELADGEWRGWTGRRFPAGAEVAGQVIATGQPCVETIPASAPQPSSASRTGEVRTVACVPLISRGETVGALMAGSRTAIGPAGVRILTAIGEIAANAVQRATLYERTVTGLQRLTALRTIDMTITASLDLRLTLNVLLDQVTARLQADAAAVLLFNPQAQVLEYAAGRGFTGDAAAGTPLRIGEGVAGCAAFERRPVSEADLAEAPARCRRFALLAQEGFTAYHAVPFIAKGEVKGVLEVFRRVPFTPDREWRDFLEAVADQGAIAIDNAGLFANLQRSNAELVIAYDATIEGWSRALDLRDQETEGHSLRVTELTLRLARTAGMPEEELVHVRRGALLHDIGKMGIPDLVLLKPGPLDPAEEEIMRRHPLYARDLLYPIVFLRPAIAIPYCHHEKWDGSGYPRGLRGEEIPLPARLFALVDMWDALRSDRPYRTGWPEAKTRDHIGRLAGSHFDPDATGLFLDMKEM